MSDYPASLDVRPLTTWRPCVGLSNYAISNDGQVRREVGGRGHRAGRVLKPLPHPRGYQQVNLWHDGRLTRRTIHSLVAEAFLGPRPDGQEIDHIDGDKHHNHVDNLEYVTSSENKRRRHRLELAKRVLDQHAGGQP